MVYRKWKNAVTREMCIFQFFRFLYALLFTHDMIRYLLRRFRLAANRIPIAEKKSVARVPGYIFFTLPPPSTDRIPPGTRYQQTHSGGNNSASIFFFIVEWSQVFKSYFIIRARLFALSLSEADDARALSVIVDAGARSTIQVGGRACRLLAGYHCAKLSTVGVSL